MTARFVHDGGNPADRARSAIVLLHGAGMDHSVWRGLARHLAHHGHRVLAPDLPGHGRSAGPPLRSIDAMADWVLDLLTDFEVEEATVIGHSMGALVALRMGAIAGRVVQRLVVICSGSRLEVHPHLQEAADARDRKAVDLILSWSFGPAGRMGGQTDPGTSALIGCRRVLENGLGSLGSDLRACTDYVTGASDAAAVGAPSLVLSGSEDRMVHHRLAADLASILSDARFELVPGGGHMLMVQQPEQVRGLVDGMLAQSQPRGSRELLGSPPDV